MRSRLIYGSLLMLAGCGYSVEEVKQKPVALEMTVAVPWDRVGTCIASTFASDFHVLYLPVPSEARAEVIVQLGGSGDPRTLFVFDVVGGQATKVTWRKHMSATAPAWERKAREAIERCGKA